MDPGDNDEPSREELESRVEQLEQTVSKMLPDRRGVIKGLGAAAIGGAAVGGATGGASGQSAAGQIGTESEPVDVEGAQGNFNSVNTGELSGKWAEKVLVYGAGGVHTVIDPASTTTPIGDALAAASAGDTISLPPGGVTEGATLNWKSSVNLETRGGWNGAQIDMSGVTGKLISFDGVGNCIFDPFRLIGPGDTATATDGLVFETSQSEKLYFRGVAIRGIHGAALRSAVSGSYQIVFDKFFATLVDAGGTNGVITFERGGPDWTFRNVWAYPSASNSASNSTIFAVTSTGGTSLHLGALNIGGSAGRAVSLATIGQTFTCGPINYEPDSQQSTPDAIIYDGTGGKPVRVDGPVLMNDAGGGAADAAYKVDGAGNSVLGSNLDTTAFTVNHVNVTSDYGNSEYPVIYAGVSGQVTNNTGGSLTNGVACQGDFTLVT